MTKHEKSCLRYCIIMKNIASKVSTLNTSLIKEEKSLNKDDILSFFKKACKKTTKIGMEFERLPLDVATFRRKLYFEDFGIRNLLNEFCQINNWEKICENNFIIGAQKDGITISLEPGAQIEISTPPQNNIFEIEQQIIETDKQLLPLCAKYNIKLCAMGVAPFDDWKDIHLIPKKRYHIMNELLSGEKAPTMMRETAGIQMTFDYRSETDAMEKLKLALMLSPFTTAMFANSPFHLGKVTEYKSFRASAWLKTDEKRCGLINSKIFSDDITNLGFEDYVDTVLKVPMLFFIRGEKYIQIKKHFTFETFMEKGFDGYFPTMDDFLLHLNLYFPEVRLRNYIEIRNIDSLSGKMKYAPATIYKAILYNKEARENCFELFKNLTFKDFAFLRENVPKYALKTPCHKSSVLDYAKEIISLAQAVLSTNSDIDEIYLEEISSLTTKGKTPAGILIKNKEKFCL